MNNKYIVFRQNEPLWVLEIIAFWTGIIIFFYFAVYLILFDIFVGFSPSKTSPSFGLGVGIILLVISIFSVPSAHSIATQNIHIDSNKIWMTGDILLPKDLRTQQPAKVLLSEIVNIYYKEKMQTPIPEEFKEILKYYNNKDAYAHKRILLLSTKNGRCICFNTTHFTDNRFQEIVKTLVKYIHESDNNVYNGKTSDEILFGPDYKTSDSSND